MEMRYYSLQDLTKEDPWEFDPQPLDRVIREALCGEKGRKPGLYLPTSIDVDALTQGQST
jgi:hypothetical protein